MDAVLGISIGPLNARLQLVVKETGDLIAKSNVGIVTGSYLESRDIVLRAIIQIALRRDDVRLTAVGVCVTGELSVDGQILWSRAVPTWKGRNPQIDIQDDLQVPVLAIGSGSAAARGEFVHPDRHGSFVYVLWGAGFSVTNVEADGYVQPTGLGHTIIPVINALRCSCGRSGHPEAQIAGANLSKRFGGRPVDQLTNRDWQLVLNDAAVVLHSASLANTRVPIVVADRMNGSVTSRLGLLQNRLLQLTPHTQLVPVVLPALQTQDPKLVGAVVLAREAAQVA